MARTIDEFKSAFREGVARANRYEVIVSPPLALAGSFASMKNLSIACEAVEFPGILLATQEDKQFGPIRKVPYLNVFNDLSMVFICSSLMIERTFFDAWQALILERRDIQIANPNIRLAPGFNPDAPLEPQFKLEFYDNYIGGLLITILDESNTKIKTIECVECYPIEVITQPLSYNNVDDYLKLEVRFAYRYWI